MGFHSPLRKSHLQPSTALPPSSFSRQTGSTFRDSLRRIPSSIFTRSDQTKKEMERKKSAEMLNGPAPAYTKVASVRAPAPDVGTVKVEKEKKIKAKTRKALGEIFGWGNSSSASAPAPVISPPSPLRRTPPTPPAKAPTPPIKDATILRKAPPSTLTRKASSNTFGTVASQLPLTLRAPLAPKHRPSIGEDPFGRDDTGAEVVVHAPKRDTHAASIKSDFSIDRRRDSMYSAKALSTKTVGSDDFSVHETAMRARMSSPRRVTMASVIEEKKRMSNSPPRPASSTAPTLHPLIAPPPRSDSLNYNLSTASRQPAPRVRVTNAPVYIPAPTPLPIAVSAPSGFDKKPLVPALRKERTKSRVWGFLGLKGAKGKEGKENEVTKRELSETIRARPLVLGNSIQLLRHGISRPDLSAPIRSSVPVFHVSHPSIDTSSAECTDSPSPMPRVMYPEPVWRSNNTLIVDTPNKRDSGSTIASFTDFKAAIEEANGLGGGTAEPFADFLAGPKVLPKRKSLNGLFGLSIKRSSSDLQGQSLAPISGESFASEHSAFEWTPPKLRPLSEEMEMTFGSFGAGGQDMAADATSQNSHRLIPDPSLRRVASATDKLVNLVTTFDFSPAPSPMAVRLAPVSSLNCLKDRLSNSPTPIRKSKSAMLFHKSNTPPVKPSTSISPLKYVLHRAHVRKMDGVGICATKPASDSPPPSSLVKRGMRNPFAPPSPERGSGGSTTPAMVSGSPLAKKTRPALAFGPAMGLAGFMNEPTAEDDDEDVPADLRAMFVGLDGDDIDLGALGLPEPPMGRVAPRRPARAAPKISLPPVPPLPAAYQQEEAPTPLPLNIRTTISEDEDFGGDRYSTPTAEIRGPFTFAAATTDNRNSFDFTGEYEELDRGAHRASFVEALHRISSADMLSQRMVDLPPLPPLPAGPLYTIEQSPESVRTVKAADSTADMFADAPEPTRYVSPIRSRKAPFQGTFAFQQQISHTNKSSPSLTPPDSNGSAQLSVPTDEWKMHHRGESGLSIATLSSVGSVIDTSETAREYTNYFEANFSQHLAKQTGVHCRTRTVSTDSAYGNMSDPRAPTRRAHHHRRSSSIASVESIGIVGHVLSTGPPNSLYNNVRRSGYISKHRRDGSVDSAFGRSDWASHRRSTSSDSTTSVVSVSRIARPAGPSERMFQLDIGIQLTSITGSPADALHHARRHSWESTGDVGQDSYDSIFDAPGRDASFDSIFDGPGTTSESDVDGDEKRYSLSLSSTDKRSSGSSDSIFGTEAAPAVIKQAFFLKGMRPVSAISSGMTSETGEDTFIDVKRYIRRGGMEECFEGVGEDRMTPIQENLSRSIGGSSLSGSISRPAKPNSARRRRPAHLDFSMFDPETPGLTSPSTSETSSRLSLETRFSSERGMGHFRQKSSANVHLQATIKEEISMATLCPPKSSNSPRIRIQLSRENLRRQDARGFESESEDDDDSTECITAWVRFQREADEVCRQAKSEYRDSAESRAVATGYQGRFSPQSVAEFLAQSAASYKPLDNKSMPVPRDQAHRRKASLADARALTSPYGLPLPKPHGQAASKPRGSLTTKFERSNSAGPTKMSDDPSAGGTPRSGIFDHLMSDLVPSPPRSAPMMMTGGKPSPFAQFMPHSANGDVFNLASTAGAKRGKASDPPIRSQPLYQKRGANQADTTEESRARVDSGTRRKALGWGRRRNSDGPETAVPVISKVIPLGAGLGPRKTSKVVVMKENSTIPPVPVLKPLSKASTRKSGAVRPLPRATGSGGTRAIRA